MQLDDILQALSGLSIEQLNQITSKIQLLKATGGNPSQVTPLENDEALLLFAITEYFEGRGLENCNPAILRRTSGYNAFKQKVPDVCKYLRTGFSVYGTLERTATLSVFRLAVELLYTDMAGMGIAVSSRSLLSQIHRIPAVLNKAFPGYAQRHLLWLVVRQR